MSAIALFAVFLHSWSTARCAGDVHRSQMLRRAAASLLARSSALAQAGSTQTELIQGWVPMVELEGAQGAGARVL